MAETTSAKIYGLKEMEDALKKIHKELHGKEGRPVNSALRAVQRAVQARAVEAAPVKTGRLRRSIIRKTERRPKYAAVYYVGTKAGKDRDDETGAWYAPIVEFQGGKGGEGKGFLRRSIVPEEDGRIYAKSLATSIQRLAKKIGDENLRQVATKVRKANS